MLLYEIVRVLYRKPMQTLILFFLILAITTLSFAGLLLYNAARQSQETTLNKIGATLMLMTSEEYADYLLEQYGEEVGTGEVGGMMTMTRRVPDHLFPPVTEQMREAILSLPHVVGYESLIWGAFIARNFNNVKLYTGVDPATQSGNLMEDENPLLYQDSVPVNAGLFVPLLETFRREQNRLIEGVYPDAAHPGLLISQQLAEQNGLSLGDSLDLSLILPDDTVEETVHSAPIVGIYETSLKFEILESNYEGTGVFSGSPYNYIYTDYGTGVLLTNGQDEIISSLEIYVDKPENLLTVAQEIHELPFDWSKFQLNNATQDFYNEFSGQLDSLIGNVTTFIVISLIAGTVLFLLVISLYQKNYMHDVGIWLTLGKRKRHIVLHKTLESLILAIPAIGGAVGIGYLISTALLPLLNQQIGYTLAENVVGCMFTGEYDLTQPLSLTISGTSVLQLFGFGMVLVLLSIALPTASLMRYNTRDIFSKGE